MVANVLEAENLLREAFIVHENNETSADIIAKSYDKAIKAAPKGDSVYVRAVALKATMYFLKYKAEKDAKVKAKLLTKAAKFAAEAAKDENNLLGIYADAKIRLEQKKTTEAEIEPIIKKVKSTEANSWADHMAQFFICLKEGGPEAKLEKAKKLILTNEFKGDFRPYYMMAFAAQDSGEIDLALETYKKVIELEPRLLQSYFESAICFGKKSAAEADTEKCMELLRAKKEMLLKYREARTKAKLKDDDGVLSHLGIVLVQLEEFEEDYIEAKNAVKLFPKEFWTHVNLGMACSKKPYKNEAEREKLFKESMKSFEKAEKFNSGSAYTMVCKAYAYEHFGKVAEAIECLQVANRLMTRIEAKEELKASPEVQGFMDMMLGEKLKLLKEQKDLDTISIQSNEDEVVQALGKKYNEDAESANKKAKAALDGGAEGTAKQVSEAILSYNMRAELEGGRAKIVDVQSSVAELRSDEAGYNFFHGFYQTLSAAKTSATLAAEGKFQLQGSTIAEASNLLTLLPFGGSAAAAIVKGGVNYIVKKNALSPMTKIFDVCTDFEFGPLAAQLALKVTYAKQQSLASDQPKVTTRFGKWKASLQKIFSDGMVEKFYNDPNKLEGHTAAVSLLDAIYKGEKGPLPASPRADFEARAEDYALKHCLDSDSMARSYDSTLEAITSAISGAAGLFASAE